MKDKRFIVAMTGASGARYSLRLVRELLSRRWDVSLLISEAGFSVLQEECGLQWQGDEDAVRDQVNSFFSSRGVIYYGAKNFTAPVASGSSAADAMIICPASMGTVARVACGISSNLIERCADVMLKERRPLVLVPRETPLSEIHLENMLRLARAGARLVPAMPAFYQNPASVDDMVDFVVGKVLDSLGIDHSLYRRWGTEEVDA